jgi:predicted HD phosphohydrolase
MDTDSAEQFSQNPGLRDMLRLRSWDELAKDPAWHLTAPCSNAICTGPAKVEFTS